MVSIRKIPISAIPMMVMLAGCAILFFAFFIITSNTANILAWGFDGIPHLEESTFSLFIYEMVHTTYPYFGFLLGILIVGIAASILSMYSLMNERKACKTLWIIWSIGLISFIATNIILMTIPNASYLPKYLDMMITNLDPEGSIYNQDIDPFRFWPFAIPAIGALFLLFFKSFPVCVRVQTIT